MSGLGGVVLGRDQDLVIRIPENDHISLFSGQFHHTPRVVCHTPAPLDFEDDLQIAPHM